jgi:hypothetical protein
VLNYSSLSLEFVDALTDAHSDAVAAEPSSTALNLNATCVISVAPLNGPALPLSAVQSLVECVLALPAATSGGRYSVHAAFCVRLNPAGGSSGSSGGAEDKCGEAASQPIRIDTVDRSSPTGAPTNQPLPPPPPPSNADASALAWLLGPGLVLWVALLILLAVCCCRQRYFRSVLSAYCKRFHRNLPFSFFV